MTLTSQQLDELATGALTQFRITELELSLLQDVSVGDGVPREVAERVWKTIAKKYDVVWDSILPASLDDLRLLVGRNANVDAF